MQYTRSIIRFKVQENILIETKQVKLYFMNFKVIIDEILNLLTLPIQKLFSDILSTAIS